MTIYTTDTSFVTKKIEIHPLKKLSYSIGKEGNILVVDTLSAHEVCRWLAPDPKTQFKSPYSGMGNNPIVGIDPDGGWVVMFNLGGIGSMQHVAAGLNYSIAISGKGSLLAAPTRASIIKSMHSVVAQLMFTPSVGVGSSKAAFSFGTSVTVFPGDVGIDDIAGLGVNVGYFNKKFSAEGNVSLDASNNFSFVTAGGGMGNIPLTPKRIVGGEGSSAYLTASWGFQIGDQLKIGDFLKSMPGLQLNMNQITTQMSLVFSSMNSMNFKSTTVPAPRMYPKFRTGQ